MQRDVLPQKPAPSSLKTRAETCRHDRQLTPLKFRNTRHQVLDRELRVPADGATGREAAARKRLALSALTDTNSRRGPLSSSQRSQKCKNTVKQGHGHLKKSINNDKLWEKIRQQKMSQFMKPTASSRQRSKGDSTTTHSIASETSKISGDPKRPRLRDADFRKRVLLPRQICFPSETESSDAFAHFGTVPPTGGDYGTLEQMQHINVWIPTEDRLLEDVIREYTSMWNERFCETEFADYAKEVLLRRTPRHPSYEETREWRVERMVEFTIKPSTTPNSRLRPPPATVNAETLEYDFIFRPDLQYYLSVRSFNPEYMRLFSRYIHIHNDRITAPYFTTEYKRDCSSIEKAQDQIAVAAATALYNRCLLKIERLKVTGKCWTKRHTTSLRHYALTLQGASYTFWCVRLKGTPTPLSPCDWRWPGCDVVEATTGSMLTKPNVKHFIQWVNEIHRWGLSVHGPSCQKDVQFCIEGREKNVRTSLYASGLDPDSDQELDYHAQAESNG